MRRLRFTVLEFVIGWDVDAVEFQRQETIDFLAEKYTASNACEEQSQ